jgi:hypothetical protein
MAESARTMDSFKSLLLLADRFDALAEQRDRPPQSMGKVPP